MDDTDPKFASLEPGAIARFSGEIENTLTGLVAAAAENKAFVTVNVSINIDGRDDRDTTIER